MCFQFEPTGQMTVIDQARDTPTMICTNHEPAMEEKGETPVGHTVQGKVLMIAVSVQEGHTVQLEEVEVAVLVITEVSVLMILILLCQDAGELPTVGALVLCHTDVLLLRHRLLRQ